MANNVVGSKQIDELVACTNPQATDLIVLVANSGSNTEQSSVNTFLNNTAANMSTNVMTATTLIATDNTTPLTSADTMTQGRIWYDDDYLYVAIGPNNIKRVALTSF